MFEIFCVVGIYGIQKLRKKKKNIEKKSIARTFYTTNRMCYVMFFYHFLLNNLSFANLSLNFSCKKQSSHETWSRNFVRYLRMKIPLGYFCSLIISVRRRTFSFFILVLNSNSNLLIHYKLIKKKWIHKQGQTVKGTEAIGKQHCWVICKKRVKPLNWMFDWLTEFMWVSECLTEWLSKDHPCP